MASKNLILLKFFLLFPEKSFTVKEISKALHFSLPSVYWLVQDLHFQGFISYNRGYPARYSLVEDLFKFYGILEKRQNTYKVNMGDLGVLEVNIKNV
jgi:sugar-specific transcriptional regulator TrmB